MARKDQVTGKSALSGNKRSHALNTSKRKWNLNLQKIKIVDESGKEQTIKVSARTLRSLRKNNKLA